MRPCRFYPREGTHCPDRVGGRVCPGVVLGVFGKKKTLYICRYSTPDRPVRSLRAVVVNHGGTLLLNDHIVNSTIELAVANYNIVGYFYYYCRYCYVTLYSATRLLILLLNTQGSGL